MIINVKVFSGEQSMKNESGLSLVEVVVATVVIVVIAGGVFATSTYASRSDLIVQQKLIAISRAEARMNLWRAQGVTDLADNTSEELQACSESELNDKPCCNMKKSNIYECFSEMDGRMNLAVSTIVKVPDPSDLKTKYLVVRADWQDLIGAARDEETQTLIKG